MPGDDDERFSDLMGDVDRRTERDGRLPPDAGRGREPRRRSSPDGASDEDARRFVTPNPEEPLAAYAAGVDRRTWQRLKRGAIEPDRSVDLHGMTAREARGELESEILAAVAAGQRCVRVVHGVGRHSQAGPVLRRELPAWLAAPPAAAHVIAFAPSRSADGGHGATLVLLTGG